MGEIWTHKDVVTDVFEFDDLLDAHEMLRVRVENEDRAQQAADRAAKVKGG